MFLTRKKTELPTPDDALPGREPSDRHVAPSPRTRHAADAAVPGGKRARDRRHGLLLGCRAALLAGARRPHDRGGLRGWEHPEPDLRGDLHRPHRPCGGRSRRLSTPTGARRGALEGVLGGARPDPGHASGQRRRHEYRSAIYWTTSEQRLVALETRDRYPAELAAAHRGAITTELAEAGPFYYAEDYHQQYLAANPNGYCGLAGTGVACPVGTGVAQS